MRNRALRTPGIILAGTFPWANSAFDQLLPRPLVPVALRPLLGYSLSWMQDAGLERVVICGNRNSRALENPIVRQYSRELDLTYLEDTMPRGAAGCVLDATQSFEGQTVVVTDGAVIPTLALERLLDTHERTSAAMTMAVYRDGGSGGYPRMHVPAGLYVLDRRVIDMIPTRGFVDIKEHLIPKLVRAGERIATCLADEAVPRVLDAETYLAANELAMQAIAAGRLTLTGFERRGDALIHHDAVVDPSVILAGPLMVAPGAVIEPRAVVVGPTTIGADVTIGEGAVVSRSAVWRRSRIEARAVVDRSIVGDDGFVACEQHVSRGVVIGAGARRAPSVEVRVGRVDLSPRSAA